MNLKTDACHHLLQDTRRLVAFMFILMTLSGCVVAINATEAGPQSAAAHSPSAGSPPTVIYLVRHAEKETTSSDPELSVQGKRRAAALNRFLANEPIDVLLSSDYRRTKATLKPLALRHNLDIKIYDAGNPAALVAKVLDQYAGKRMVIAGHSNTVPDLAGRFQSSGELNFVTRADLDHDEYERIFVVIIPGQGSATLLELAYPGIGP
ncbi:MAG: histidine phosphatase family protein [Gammaproteobacteria bacterium]|nr:histidine phosphatase family protein [Gammaproteobacteria bacterium]